MYKEIALLRKEPLFFLVSDNVSSLASHEKRYTLQSDSLQISSQIGTQEVRLTTKEVGLVTYLLKFAGQSVCRYTLFRYVWGYESSSPSRALDVAVSRLRKKLRRHLGYSPLVTVHGVGYRWGARLERTVTDAQFQLPDRVLNLQSGLIMLPGQGRELSLSNTELVLVRALVDRLGSWRTKEDLAAHCPGLDPKNLPSTMSRLKGKLEHDPELPVILLSAPFLGYQITRRVQPL